MRQLFRRAGGKARLLKHIMPHVPTDAKCYVEPFAGGASFTLTHPKRAALEVINDLDGEIVNVFRVARAHPIELARQFELLPNSLEEFKRLVGQSADGLTDVQRAANWIYRNRLGFAGFGKDFGWQRISGGGGANSLPTAEFLEALAARLTKVIIDHRPYEKVLRGFDAADTFFFLDPPYLAGKCEYGAWRTEDFEQLAALLKSLKGRWMLTTSGHAEMRDIFRSYSIKELTRVRGINNKKGRGTYYEELLICHL